MLNLPAYWQGVESAFKLTTETSQIISGKKQSTSTLLLNRSANK